MQGCYSFFFLISLEVKKGGYIIHLGQRPVPLFQKWPEEIKIHGLLSQQIDTSVCVLVCVYLYVCVLMQACLCVVYACIQAHGPVQLNVEARAECLNVYLSLSASLPRGRFCQWTGSLECWLAACPVFSSQGLG